MTSLKSVLAVLVASFFILNCPYGQAKGYPFSGYFAFVNSNLTGSLDPAMCAFSFFHQRPDGIAISYHIDAARFEATKEIRYLEYNRTHCVYNDALRRETCKVTFDTDKAADRQTLDSAFDSIRRNYIILSGQYLFRCPFDAEKLATAVAGEISGLDIEERNKTTWPTLEMLTSPAAAEIMRRMGLEGSMQ